MRNTFWFAVDYDGTGHLFTYKPERDTGIWIGKEALHIPQGAFKEMFARYHLAGYSHSGNIGSASS